jgi:hypothetical protein
VNARSPWDDAQIYAYVDGELDASTAARLEADSRADTVLAARIAAQRELRARLGAELDPVLAEPLPQRLREALGGAGHGEGITPIGAARARGGAVRSAWSLREWTAVAATLVLGVLVGFLASRSSGDLPFEVDRGRLVAADYLDTALSTQLAGAPPQRAAARIGMSFRAAGGEYCRTFTIEAGAGGLACRREGRWSVELLDAAAGPPGSTDGFRQASSALSPAMLGAIAALGAGDPLTADEERQRLESGWERSANEPGR